MKWAIMTLNKESIKLGKKVKKLMVETNLSKSRVLDKSGTEFIDLIPSQVDIYTLSKYLEEGTKAIDGKIRAFNEYLFEHYECIIYIMAMGIVVRDISPYIKHKSFDPAVLCMSIDGRFIIPVLSGHLGGANDISKLISSRVDSTPVITTASDLLGKLAVDLIAKKYDLIIDSFKRAMDLTARIINEEAVTILSELDNYVDEAIYVSYSDMEGFLKKDLSTSYVYIGYHKQINTHKAMAKLICKKLVIGIGAKKNTSIHIIKEMLIDIFNDNNLDLRAIHSFRSIDIKKQEEGIVHLAEELKVPFITYTAEEIAKVSLNFEESEFVKSITGVGAVSMPCGYLGSNYGKCIVKKIANKGITISVWEEI